MMACRHITQTRAIIPEVYHIFPWSCLLKRLQIHTLSEKLKVLYEVVKYEINFMFTVHCASQHNYCIVHKIIKYK